MEKEYKNFIIKMNIEDNMWMDYLKVMDNTFGQMVLNIKVILNKDLEMGMEFGKRITIVIKIMQDIMF